MAIAVHLSLRTYVCIYTHTYLSEFIEAYLVGKQVNLPTFKLFVSEVKFLLWNLTIITYVLLSDDSVSIKQVKQWRGNIAFSKNSWT